MDNRPLSVSITLGFVVLNGLIWMALGLIIAFDLHPALPNIPLLKAFMAVLSLAAAGVLLGLFFFLSKRSRIAYLLALGCFAGNILVTLFDDIGLVDLAFLAVNIIPIILLIRDRRWYLGAKKTASGTP